MNPFQSVAAGSYPATQAPQPPNRHELVRATREFTIWVNSVMPNSRAFLSGGLALSLYGNGRHTTDADVAIDLSETRRPGSNLSYDVGALKQMARADPRFIVGPKIYWVLDAGTPHQKPVQVDFVDAALYWSPFSPAMVDMSHNLPVPCLNLPTLLVGKIKSATERSQSDEDERLRKQMHDITDFYFALVQCCRLQLVLGPAQLSHLGPTVPVALLAVQVCSQLKAYLEQNRLIAPFPALRGQWNLLVQGSQMPPDFLDVFA